MQENLVCIHTFGCQMNKLDSELLAEALADAGYTLTANEDAAGVIVFNTCSVRAHAEQRVLSRVGALKRRKSREPGLRIVVMGCFAQRLGPELIKRLPHVDVVCGTRRLLDIPRLLRERTPAGKAVVSVDEKECDAPGLTPPHTRSRHQGPSAYVSVMRGCNNFCAYCIVPHVRGRERSRPPAAVVSEVEALARRGTREVTLLGQNIDAYGRDLGTDLASLLRAVHEVDGILRIRFVTSHPRDVTPALLSTMQALPKVCDHLHMPAQSGSDRVLKTMGRGYTRAQYERKLEMVRALAPGALVASDFIVGFPGETDDDFERTLELVRAARFQNSYIFKYSPRPGTAAARLDDDVPLPVKRERNQRLLKAQEEVNRRRLRELLGSRQEILVEGVSARDATRLSGRTGTNLICVIPRPERGAAPIGELITVRITGCTALTLFGEPETGQHARA